MLRQSIRYRTFGKCRQACPPKRFRRDCRRILSRHERRRCRRKGALVKRYYHDVEKEAVRRCILDEGIRLDGRTTTQIRPIWCEVDYIPGPHGSAVFTRGETQSLSTVTLGTKLDEKILDDVLNQVATVSCCTITSPLSPLVKPKLNVA